MLLYSVTMLVLYILARFLYEPHCGPFFKACLKFINAIPTLQSAAGFITCQCCMKISLRRLETCLTCVKLMFSLHYVFIKAKFLLNGSVVASRKRLMNMSTLFDAELALCFSREPYFFGWLSKCECEEFSDYPLWLNFFFFFFKCYNMLKVPCGVFW